MGGGKAYTDAKYLVKFAVEYRETTMHARENVHIIYANLTPACGEQVATLLAQVRERQGVLPVRR